MVYGSWFMVPGSEFMVPGSWFRVGLIFFVLRHKLFAML